MEQKLSEIKDGELQISLFKDREIRRVFQNQEWYWSIIDIIRVLTDTSEPASYWAKIKNNDLSRY